MTYVLLMVSSALVGWLTRDFFNKRRIKVANQSDKHVTYPDHTFQQEKHTPNQAANNVLGVDTRKRDKSEKIPLAITDLTEVEADKSFYVYLSNDDGEKLCLAIGYFEAQLIAIEIGGMKPERPLTFDLLQTLILIGNFSVKEIVINALINGIFHATVILQGVNGGVKLDARPSDAFVIALKNKAPIYTYKSVIEAYQDTGLN